MVPVEVERPKPKAMSQKKKPHQKRMWTKQVILINFLEKARKRKSNPISWSLSILAGGERSCSGNKYFS
jgi:hypothetical protein